MGEYKVQEKLLKIIQEEDKKNPLTDEECAKLLFINRHSRFPGKKKAATN
jgi:DNA-directed RNA polymerase specialized sigma54-like protein